MASLCCCRSVRHDRVGSVLGREASRASGAAYRGADVSISVQDVRPGMVGENDPKLVVVSVYHLPVGEGGGVRIEYRRGGSNPSTITYRSDDSVSVRWPSVSSEDSWDELVDRLWAWRDRALE